MKLLIIGGTVFLGRALTEAALERGHVVTLFNRGKSNPDLFPDVEHLHGDRRSDVSALDGRQWDAVIDTCGFVTADVETTTQALRDKVKHYTFISSLSVYADNATPHQDESAPTLELGDQPEDARQFYGECKVLCENVVQQAFPNHALIVRPGLIVGRYDYTGRFSYWTDRVARGGMMLAPESPDWLFQVIDVRDLAEWIIRSVENNTTGVFNAVGSPQPFGDLLDQTKQITGSDAEFVWVEAETLQQHEVAPWTELPLWLPSNGDYAGFMQFDNSKAQQAGMTFRPLADTIRDTLHWSQIKPDHTYERAAMLGNVGLSPEREATILAKSEIRNQKSKL